MLDGPSLGFFKHHIREMSYSETHKEERVTERNREKRIGAF